MSLLTQAWRLYRTTLGRQLGFFVPLLVLLYATQGLILGSIPAGAQPSFGESFGFVVLGLLLPALVGSLLVAGSHAVMVDDLVGDPPPTSESLGTLRPVRRPLLMGAAVAMILNLLLSLFPVFNTVSFASWGPPILVSAVVLEGCSLPDAWRRTRVRLKGWWAKIVLNILAVSLLLGVLSFTLFASVATLLSVPLQDAIEETPLIGSVLARTVLGLSFSVTLPYLAAVMLLSYFDGRVRAEDFDLETMATERHARRPEPPADA